MKAKEVKPAPERRENADLKDYTRNKGMFTKNEKTGKPEIKPNCESTKQLAAEHPEIWEAIKNSMEKEETAITAKVAQIKAEILYLADWIDPDSGNKPQSLEGG